MISTHLFEVELREVDLVYGSNKLVDFTDVYVEDLLDRQYLRYDETTKKWRNVSLEELLLDSFIQSEAPTKISSKVFQTDVPYISGSLQVFLNGIKEKYIIETSDRRFTFDIDTKSTDDIEISYMRKS